jgi:hypothetical protein
MQTHARPPTALVALALLAAAPASCAPFSAGNVVALRLGSESFPFATMRSSGRTVPAFLDEYSPSGALVQSIALPASAGVAPGGGACCTVSSLDAYAGGLQRSQDESLLLVGGFDANAGSSAASADFSFANQTSRVVARVRADGSVDTSLRLTSYFSGNLGSGGGTIRLAASDNGADVYAAGTDALYGNGIVFANQTIGSAALDTIKCVLGDFRGCEIHEDRLFATSSDGWIYAIEDLRSYRPGLPDAAFDMAYPPTARKVSQPQVVDGAIAGIDLSGDLSDGGTIAWVASGDSKRCLDSYDFNSYAPEDYTFDFGYLDGGKNDLFGGSTRLLDLPGAKALCDSIEICAGITFFYNASFYSPPRPWTPQTKLQTYLKGPFFWFTRTGDDKDEGDISELWYSFQKPAVSGNFNFTIRSSTSAPCSTGSFGFFDLAVDDDSVPGQVPSVYFSAGDGLSLVKLDVATNTPKLFARAPAGSIYRGIAMAPTTNGPPLPPSNAAQAGPPASPGSVAAGILTPLILVAAGAYLFVYRRAETAEALKAAAAGASTALAVVLGGSGPRLSAEKVSLMAGGAKASYSNDAASRRLSPTKSSGSPLALSGLMRARAQSLGS